MRALPERLPEVGELVRVRSRRWLVEEVVSPSTAGQSALVSLACADDDAQGQALDVFWEYELDRRILEVEGFEDLAAKKFDDPRQFAAFLHTLRWNCVTATDRLLGLLWAVLEGGGPLLLEEPELSLHEAVVRHLPGMISKAARSKRKGRRQVLISTHSTPLLSDESIDPQDVLLLRPTPEDTVVVVASTLKDVGALLEGGVPMGEAVLPRVAPANPEQLLLKFSD